MTSASLSEIITKSASGISSQTYAFLQKHVHQTTGIVLDGGKEYLMEARLAPVLKECNFDSIDQLCVDLARTPVGKLHFMVIDAMTTNETLFFRDHATFEALRTMVLPDLLRKTAGRKLQIWSAASSSGQEAYSIAMLLLDMGVQPAQVDIFGSDISKQMLAKARAGRYVQFEMNRGLPPKFLCYFERVGLDWQVKPEVRRMVRFDQRDLRDASTKGSVDLLLCRNVLIYFDNATKLQILRNLHSSLYQHGVLVLGCAETVINFPVGLQRNVFNHSAFYTR